MSKASGVEKLSADAMAAARARLDDRSGTAAEQLALPVDGGGEGDTPDLGASEAHIALPDPSEIMAIAMEEGVSMEQAIVRYRDPARRGRPKGARNRRTDDLAKYLLTYGPDPAVTLMRIQGRPVDLLAAELGCDKAAAAQLITRAASELMPYIHGKKPVDVNVSSAGHMTLVLEAGSGVVGGPIEGDFELVAQSIEPAPESQQNRGFLPDETEPSE